jgi:hypothetical protein
MNDKRSPEKPAERKKNAAEHADGENGVKKGDKAKSADWRDWM